MLLKRPPPALPVTVLQSLNGVITNSLSYPLSNRRKKTMTIKIVVVYLPESLAGLSSFSCKTELNLLGQLQSYYSCILDVCCKYQTVFAS